MGSIRCHGYAAISAVLVALVTAIFAVGAQASATPDSHQRYSISLRDFGAVCDGRHDDKAALEKALVAIHSRGGGTLLVPAGDCRIVQTEASPITEVSGPITLRGTSARSRISLDRDEPGSFRELLKITGSDVVLNNLTLDRVSGGLSVLIDIYGSHRFHLDHVVVNGRQSLGDDGHGIKLSAEVGQVISGARITDSVFQDCAYALFQASPTLGTVNDFAVDHSTFLRSHYDDLEFNAPMSTMTNVRVTNSTFRDNQYSDAAAFAGFGVGLANVQYAVVRNNTFDNYYYDPVHIEDRSSNITVDGNRFRRSFTIDRDFASVVFIVNDSHFITITRNVFDTRGTTNDLAGVYTGSGGGTAPPSDITITRNLFILRPGAQPLRNIDSPDVVVKHNTVVR